MFVFDRDKILQADKLNPKIACAFDRLFLSSNDLKKFLIKIKTVKNRKCSKLIFECVKTA